MKGGGHALPPTASWSENTITSECTQESGHLYSLLYSLVVCRINDNSNNFFFSVNSNGNNWSQVLFTVVKNQCVPYFWNKKKFEIGKISFPMDSRKNPSLKNVPTQSL